MIQKYSFGSITVNNQTYNHDVEIRWTGEVLLWQRGESHVINTYDVKRAVEQSPEKIVIGTGESGIAEITDDAKKFIVEKGIVLLVDKTGEAARIFNNTLENERNKKIIGLFHLTC